MENVKGKNDNLWILVRLQDCVYALESRYVNAIFMLEDKIIAAADSDDVNLGILSYRDSVIPIIDLRRFLGMKSRVHEEEEFERMLEQRKQDHIRWVDELKRCVEEGDQFKLAIDPHKCAFGKWYDNYESDNQVVTFHMKKIDEPHKKLHATAHEVFTCARHCSECEREECLQISLSKAVDVYMPTVVSLLEEAKQVFKESYRKMIIVTCQEDRQYGLLVDEVLSVESLSSIVPNTQLGVLKEKQMIPYVAHRNGDVDSVLMLDMDKLYRYYDEK